MSMKWNLAYTDKCLGGVLDPSFEAFESGRRGSGASAGPTPEHTSETYAKVW